MYLESSKIKVFPATKRGTNQRSARLFSEENVSHMLATLLDADSFVVSATVSDNFQFYVHGYLFTIPTIADLTSQYSSGTIYADIALTGTDISGETYLELSSGDSDGSYEGITFLNTVPAVQANHYSLALLTSTAEGWEIASGVRQRYSTLNLSGEIDGGEI